MMERKLFVKTPSVEFSSNFSNNNGLSPVSSIGQSLQTMNVISRESPRGCPARRRLSLSMDAAVSHVDFECVTPQKSKRMSSEMDTNDENYLRDSASPYKTPKRVINFGGPPDADTTNTEELPNSQPDTDQRDLLCSSAPCFTTDFPHKAKNPLRRCKNNNSPSPLRRSTSFSCKEKMPRPSMSLSMSDLPRYSREASNHVQPPNCVLPTVAGAHPDLNSVTAQTVVDALNGLYKDSFDEIFVIDCRYDYEYNGGHIRTAMNLTPEQVQERFLTEPITDRRVAIIFHCEFSSKRAPACYRDMRTIDRKVNMARYPHVHYPDMYLLEGGFKKFFETFQDTEHCEGGYTLMVDKEHTAAMKTYIKTSRSLKRSRSQSVDMGSTFRLQDITNTQYFL